MAQFTRRSLLAGFGIAVLVPGQASPVLAQSPAPAIILMSSNRALQQPGARVARPGC